MYNNSMLRFSHTLIGTSVMSLRDGAEIGRVSRLVVDPDSLKIIAFFLSGPRVNRNTDILDAISIREISRMGFIVDSEDELVGRDDVEKIKNALELNFELIGMRVKTQAGKNLGRISEFSVQDEDFLVMQLEVKRPFFKGLMDPELLISRGQIVETNHRWVVVKDETEKDSKSVKQDFSPNYVNPFRKTEQPDPAPAHSQIPDEPDRR